MVSVQGLANTILKMGRENNVDISPMKLQKLMYFVCARYAQQYNENLISESFCVWQYGPVLTSIYDEFKSFHGNPITCYAKDSNGKSFILNRNVLRNVYEVIDDIWTIYSERSAIALSRLTHAIGSGWSNAFDRGDDIITFDDMYNDHTF